MNQDPEGLSETASDRVQLAVPANTVTLTE